MAKQKPVLIGGRDQATGLPSAVDVINRRLLMDGAGGTFSVTQPDPNLLNCDANIQVGDVDVSNANPIPVDDAGGSLTVDQATHDNLNLNANIQVGDADVANINPVPISDAGGSITVDGAVTIQEPLSVDDNGGSFTVDNPILSVVGGGAEATAQRVTIANDSTGLLSVDDGGGTFTVDQATHDNLQCNANIQVGDADVAAGNPVPTEEQETIPTDASKNNPSYALTYTAGDLTGIAMTIGVVVYNKTLGYTNGDLTSITAWA